ncbi:hypothetical protein [Paenisporosarcina sp. TG-14]|uniref:hypothetical protein n=1 Tax=Paenisporosarcina sp. TG-14 TaxID=1231057 RepID=UPI0003189A3B|nr:hypothetical protein [Paenisporosarcina sp. TG-14]
MQIENPMITGVGLPSDPQQAIVVYNCDYCNGEIYEGDSYVVYEGLTFCGSDHLGEHLVKQNLAEELTAQIENLQ